MPGSKILSASWETYDKEKQSLQQDKDIFFPEQPWEFNYLLDIIVKSEPGLDVITVILSVRKIMRDTLAPRPRIKFVQAVMQNIRERETQWVELKDNSKMAS